MLSSGQPPAFNPLVPSDDAKIRAEPSHEQPQGTTPKPNAQAGDEHEIDEEDGDSASLFLHQLQGKPRAWKMAGEVRVRFVLVLMYRVEGCSS
jgi:hypothetical protein